MLSELYGTLVFPPGSPDIKMIVIATTVLFSWSNYSGVKLPDLDNDMRVLPDSRRGGGWIKEKY
jgi:hypothetical protein